MKNTPLINTTGVYDFKKPWVNKPGVIYQCVAIRSFYDIYKLGDNVYSLYYEPMGLVTGENIPGTSTSFTFADESELEPNIITLKGSDGTTIYVPDTFINKTPDTTLVPYHQVVLAVSLGALPEYVDVRDVSDEITHLVSARLGIDTDVQVGVVPVVNNPTPEQHSVLERARLDGVPEINANLQMRFDESQKKLAAAQELVSALERVVIDNGLAQQI